MGIELFPTVLFGLIALMYAGTFAYFRFCGRFNTRGVRDSRNSMVSGALLIMYILYLNISSNTLDPLNCAHITSSETTSQFQYMLSQPSEVCWKPEAHLQRQLLPYAILFFILYTIGYPCLVSFVLLNPANSQKCMNDQLLRCMGTGSLKETNKAYFNFRSKYATLYFKFKPMYHYWIVIIIFRKLLIVTFTLLFHVNATMQFSMILLVMFLAYTLQVRNNPYLCRADYQDILGDMDEEEYEALVGPYGACPQPKGIGYDLIVDDFNATKMASGRLSMAAAVDKMKQLKGFTREELEETGKAALHFAFNYNTVESTLLFCSILICLLGLIFASNYTSVGGAL
jgi:hypothetical protein